MYYISLDEVGDFEDIKGERNSQPVFIAGIIYQADDSAEIENEKNRIRCYLEAVCTSVGKKFPENLHVGKGSSNYDVAPVKNKASNTLHDFLCGKEYHGKDKIEDAIRERKGKYIVYLYLKGPKGKTSRGKNAFSTLTKDDYASNLYLHMAEDVVVRLLFHNPVLDEKPAKYILDLATRKFVHPLRTKEEREKAKEFETKFEKIGVAPYFGPEVERNLKSKKAISESDYDTSKLSYDLTNRKNYWLSIERESFSNAKEINIDENDFKVRAISYRSGSARTMGFLYLADLVCTVLGYKLKKQDDWITPLDERINALTDGSYQIFVYDEVDTYYSNALLEYEQKNYFEMLEQLYCINEMKGCAADYYQKKLLNQLIEYAGKELDIEKYYSAVNRLVEYSYSNQRNNHKLKFMFEGMEKLHKHLSVAQEINITDYNRFSFDLFDVGASAYTHMGGSKKAFEYLNKCKEYSYAVSEEKQIINTNKIAVCYQDTFEYDKAYATVNNNYKVANILLRAIKEMQSNGSIKQTTSKALSQYGQIAAIVNPDDAELAFEEALELTRDDEKNYLITLSYYLHHLIDAKKRDEYLIWANKFWGTIDATAQLKQMIDIAKKSDKEYKKYMPEFALYIFLKALYIFEFDIDWDFADSIFRNIDKYIKKENLNFGVKGHPWELIYKYLAFIYVDRDSEVAVKYIDKILALSLDEEQIITAITLNGIVQLYQKLRNNEGVEKYEIKLRQCLKNINQVKFSDIENMNRQELNELRASLFRYMFI